MRKTLYFLPLILILANSCEPATKEQALDKTAVFDQKPVRPEGWEQSGDLSSRYDGMLFSANATSSSDGLSRQEMIPSVTKLGKVFTALESLETATLKLKIVFPKFSKNGLRFDVNFATGLGTPVEMKITESGITAKCGPLKLKDVGETASQDLKFEMNREYEFRVVRASQSVHVFVDGVAVVKDLACMPQNENDEPRDFGFLELRLHSQLPTEITNWTTADMLSNESQLLLKRVTVYKEAKLD